MTKEQHPKADHHVSAIGDLSGPASAVLQRLKAVILLSGSVRAGRLSTSIDRSLLELPIDEKRTILSQWYESGGELAKVLGRDRMPVRVMVDHTSALPTSPQTNDRVVFRVERDPFDFRGTGGVLRDLAEDYHDDDWLLVVNGAQVLLDPLAELVGQLASIASDMSLVSHRNGTPSGLMLVRCGVLKLISAAGFVDMKEQALPIIAKQHDVRVLHMDQPSGLPVRTLSDYLFAVRMHHMRLANKPVVDDPFAENLQSTFSIVEEGATIATTARVHDAVVLAGAKVSPGAIIVRSVVCSGAMVRRDKRVVDRILTAPSRGGTSGDIAE